MNLGRPLLTVTPSLDGDVLAVLARSESGFTTGQVHRLLGAFSEEGIRRVLNRLAVQGIVDATRVGAAYSYRLNRQHLAASPVIALAELMDAFLTRLGQLLDGWEVRPLHAAVFGSAARGTMQVDSDVDVFLVRPDLCTDEVWLPQVAVLTAQVRRWTGNDARVLEFTAGALSATGPPEPVLHDVLKEGLTVIGTHAWLARQLRSVRP